jgi:hypothetical protein
VRRASDVNVNIRSACCSYSIQRYRAEVLCRPVDLFCCGVRSRTIRVTISARTNPADEGCGYGVARRLAHAALQVSSANSTGARDSNFGSTRHSEDGGATAPFSSAITVARARPPRKLFTPSSSSNDLCHTSTAQLNAQCSPAARAVDTDNAVRRESHGGARD